MLISVIIPTYNEGKYIAHCLASLHKQKLDFSDEMEIVVVDDGSTDETVEKIKRFSNIKLIHQRHQGPAIARNCGAKLAKGEILVFTDADMEFDANFINDLIKPIKTNNSKGTFSKNEYVANWENSLSRCWNWNENLPPKHRLPKNTPETGSDFRAILKTEFQKVRGFDNVGYTDTWTLPAKLGYKPSCVTKAVYYHHNPENLSEILKQARWISKRKYKLGELGNLVALIRYSLPASIFWGVFKTIKYKEPKFLLFKLVYDLGATIGIMQMLITNNIIK